MNSIIEITVLDLVRAMRMAGIDKKYFNKNTMSFMNEQVFRKASSRFTSNDVRSMISNLWGNVDVDVVEGLGKNQVYKVIIQLKDFLIAKGCLRQSFYYYKATSEGFNDLEPVDENAPNDPSNVRYKPCKQYLWDIAKIHDMFHSDIRLRATGRNDTQLTSVSLMETIMGFPTDMKEIAFMQECFDAMFSKRCYDIEYDRHFTIIADGTMTYTPKGKRTVMNRNNKWVKDGRQAIKYGKGIRKMLVQAKMIIDDKAIEVMCNSLKSRYTFDHEIKLVSGYDIAKAYNGRNHGDCNSIGTLGGSCMKHMECQDYFEIYTENPDKVSLLVAVDKNGKTMARALVWLMDCGTKFMDRIYGNDSAIAKFKSYAKEQGWLHKHKQSYSDSRMVNAVGLMVEKELRVELNNSTNRQFPYMDTMKYTDSIDDDTIELNNQCGDIALESTDGGPENEHFVTLHNGDRVHQDEARWIESAGDYYHEDDVVYSDLMDEDILYDDAIEVQNEGYVTSDYPNVALCESTQDYYHIEDLSYSDYDQCYYHEVEECPLKGYVSANDMETAEVTDLDGNTHSMDFHQDVDEQEIIEYYLEEYDLEVTI